MHTRKGTTPLLSLFDYSRPPESCRWTRRNCTPTCACWTRVELHCVRRLPNPYHRHGQSIQCSVVMSALLYVMNDSVNTICFVSHLGIEDS